MSWPMVRLGSVARLINGRAYKKNELLPEGKYRVLRVGNFFSNRGWYWSDLNLPEDKYCDDGDLLYAWSASFGPQIWDGGKVIYHYHIWKLELDEEKVDKKYLFHALEYDVEKIKLEQGTGSTMIHVTKSAMEERQIPLPPLDEQKRIAAILDKADAIRQKRKQAITLADEFLRSVFLEMFGDPVTNPKGWSRKEIKEGVSRITSGWSAKGDSRPCGQGEVGVLKISAVTSGEFKPKENKFVEKHIIPEGKNLIFPKKGDLLFSRANTRELVAATCIVPKDCDDVFLPDKLWNIELSSEELMPEYFHMLLQDDKFKETLTSQATGSSGSMLNISKQKFETTLAPFAPIDLQMKFKNIYWHLKDNAANMKNSEDYLIEQFNALSQKAFSGQL
ncbi:restriction endonuclease subunit S [Vibrio cholerae]|uniref:restriction endonuclease subunit S n=1 Tax=Vibrio cholerae TaxID=666 RepID=UPI000BA94FC6|nr:restriction endonuclease subunit S [Vibrio cholerae]PAS40715.1 restriction endonuclease subunit S [Vibrio cholerae]PAS45734.1 restriction endonuclease subunit S [Vibrio cholerae]